MLIRNSIKPSNTGTCTDFNESLCDPSTFLTLSWKKNESVPLDSDTHNDEETLQVERILINMDETSPNDLRDIILYYISGFLVRKMLPNVKCRKCRQELLLDPHDAQASRTVEFPVYSLFTLSLQRGGLTLPSSAVMKLVKATEVIFKRRVISCDSGITMEKNIGLKIESSLVEQFGPDIFNNVDNHFFDHHIGQERDHLTSLLRLVVKRYLNLHLKIYGKKYTEMIAHKNLPSSRHELTKTILFLNQ